MIKKIIFICLFLTAKVHGQDAVNKIKFPEKMSLLEAKKDLKNQISEMDKLNTFSKLQFSFTPVKPNQKIPKDDIISEKKFVLNNETDLKAKISQYYNSRVFMQQMAAGYSYVTINDDNYTLEQFLKENFDNKYPNITNATFYFHDKTTKSLKTTLETFNKPVSFGKRIEKIEIEYSFDFPEIKNTVELNATNNNYKNNENFINLTKLEPYDVSFKMPDTLKSSIIAIEFLNKKNQILNTFGSSSNSIPSEETFNFYDEIKTVYKNAIAEIDTKKITSITVLEETLNTNLSKLKATVKAGNISYNSYQVQGTPTSVKFYISDKTKTITGNATINIDKYQKENGTYYVALDTISETMGFVDENGKWFKKNVGEKIKPITNNYYYVYQKNTNQDNDGNEPLYKYSVYKIDVLKKELINYKWESIDSISPKHLKIQLKTNGAYGLIDTETAKEILPIKYGYLEYFEGIFIVRESEFTHGEGLYGAFNENGETILPCIYESVTKNGNFLYAKNNNEKIIAFTLDGKPITTDKVTIYSEFGTDNIAIIENLNGKKNYINNKGEIIFQTNSYKNIEAFSNGLAIVVNKNDLKGYINTVGKLVIPCVYYDAYSFQTNYALVVNSSKQNILIDKQNKIYKIFKGTWTYVSNTTDGNTAKYNIGSILYDANGQKIINKNKQ